MAPEFVSPNILQLSGGGISVTYAISGIDGKPHLQYHDSHQNRTFSGEELHKVDSDLGTLVSVTLQMSPDAGKTSFSLLIPKVNLSTGETGLVRTEGITTIHRSSLVPAFDHGQIDIFSVTHLSGTARQVLFL
jgi:hypothetical protein